LKFSNKIKFELFIFLIILNIILRVQVVPHEIGADSFEMHIMANSISEFGYAKWILHPLSFFGLYPASYTSSMQFFLSGISQSTGIGMESTIFIYSVFIGLLSMFTAYLMAGEIIDDDLFRLLEAFGFSTAPAVLGYSTWTIPTRGLLVVLVPLLIYLLLKCRTSIKYVPLTFLLAFFLFATHHLFYFLIPAFFVFFILIIYLIFKKYITYLKIPEKLTPFIIIAGFIFMFLIPFFTGRFIENSRYASIDASYVRYVGILIIPAVGGLGYLILKHNKSIGEWFLLLTLIFLTTFVYQQTYMKWFLPIFVIPLACIGLINIIKISEKRKYAIYAVVIFLVLSLSFSGYYQFLHNYRESPFNERYIEESTYRTGQWMQDNISGSAISNDVLFGERIFATSESTHLLTSSTVANQIYGFISINISDFKRYSLMKEDFWFSGYEGEDTGEVTWEYVHRMWKPLGEFNITYVVENRKGEGNLIWGHDSISSPLLKFAYEKDLVYDTGNIYIWRL
jgi:hypothetical protein